MTDLIGKTLGKYQIVVRVGRGGMARVYKAYQQSLDRYVALKVLHSHLAEEPDFVRRFEREATAVARLRHPNIVQVFDYDLEGDLYFIVMEYVEGPTLKAELNERLKRRSPDELYLFEPEETVRLITALADAIDYAHSRGMIHRDLKPGNIMFTSEGQVLLTDFGLARIAYASRQSKTGALSGTPAYMAPEQVQGRRVDERSDIYSLGVVLYEMLVGRVPFTADSSYAVMTKHVTDEVPGLRQLDERIPEEVEAVVLHALSKDPALRYQRTVDLAAALQEAMGISVVSVPSGGLLSPIASVADSQEMMGASSQVGSSLFGQSTAESPYRGLYAFREEDAPYFFGRETFTDRLIETLELKSMAAVVGPSGSGKSSVVFAGLLPHIRGRSNYTILEMRPGSQPYQSLANALVDFLDPELGETARLLEIKKLAEALKSNELDLVDVLTGVRRRANGHRLLVVDQFEELYTLCADRKVRHAFPNTLFQAVAASRGREDMVFGLVLTLRADFMGQALADRPFADALQESDVKLGPMTRAELGRAIESPAAKKGVIFEAGLVDRILDDVGEEPGNLPLLEFALTLLWERRTGRRLSHAAYETIGRVEGSLARYADQVYEGLGVLEQDQAKRVFTQMVRPGEGTEDTRRLATKDELGEDDWLLARKLADARLVVTGRSPDGQQTVEIVHEALIRGWGRLQGWMHTERSFRRWQERLRVALRQWNDSGCDEGALLRGVPLGEAEEWLSRKRRDLSSAEQEYIQASIASREKRAAEKEEQRHRELEGARRLAEEQKRRAEAEYQRAEEQSRSSRRLRALAAILGIVFLIAVMAALWAVGESRDAERQANARATEVVVRTTAEVNARESASLAATRAQESANARVTAEAERFRANEAADQAVEAKDEAEVERDRADSQAMLALSRQLAAQSTTLIGPQLDLALLLSLQANNVSNSVETVSSILSALQATPNLVTYLRGHPGIIQSVDFSPDGTFMASVGSDGTVLLWDIRRRQIIRRYEGHDPTQLVNRVVFSPNGQVMATASDDLSIIIWDVNSGQPIDTLMGHTAWVQALDFSPDGGMLVSGGGDRNVVLWDVSNGEQVASYSGHIGPLWDIEFSPDGSLIASASADGTAIIWDAATGDQLHVLADHNGAVFNVSFDREGERLVTAGGDTTLILWDVATGEAIGEPFTGHAGGVVFADFSPDGQTIASASGDSTVRIWNAATHQQVLLFGNHNAIVSALEFSPDGQMLVTADGNGTAILWDVSITGQSFARNVTGHETGVSKLAFHPYEHLLVSAGVDSTIRLWDPYQAIQVGVPITHALRIGEPVSALAIDADEHLIASGSQDGTIMVWDLLSGQPITQAISANTNGITDLALSLDGQTLVAASTAGFISIWNTGTGNQIGPFLAGHAGKVNVVAISPDSLSVASGGVDGAVIIRQMSEVQAGQVAGTPLTYTNSQTNSVISAVFSPDGQLLATGDSRGEVALWSVADTSLMGPTLFSGGAPLASLAFSPDGSLLVSGSSQGEIVVWDVETRSAIGTPIQLDGPLAALTFNDDGRVIVTVLENGSIASWDVETNAQISFRTGNNGPLSTERILSPGGNLSAFVSLDGGIVVIDIEDGEPLGEPLNHEAPFLGNVSSVAFSPDGQVLASAGFDGAIVLWDLETRQPLREPFIGHTSLIVYLTFSPDGRYLASGSCSLFHQAGSCIEGEVIIWDLSAGVPKHILRDTIGFPQAIAFSPDSQTLVANDCARVEVAGVCLEGAIQFWDVESGSPGRTLFGHSGLIWSLVFSPNGTLLASSSADNTILIWDVISGQIIGQELTNHGGPVRRVTFSPDGTRLASAGFDTLVFLWDVASGQAIGGPIAAHTNTVMDVVFRPDGKQLVSTSLDGTIIFTDVDLDSWRDRACMIANRNLRREEWERFLGELPYVASCQTR